MGAIIYIMYKQRVYRKGHPLSRKDDGEIRKSRFVLYEKLGGEAGDCNWCGLALNWETLCADHLDSNIMNDTADNLVASCRGCNANREDGTGRGRKSPKDCKCCGNKFISKSHHKTQLYCSIKCSAASKPKRGTGAKHGTQTRYQYGCRCRKCHARNLKTSRDYYQSKKSASKKNWN
jgi:hypothetical protein